MGTWGKNTWGAWHTSDAIDEDCPQGCARRHTVGEAVELNAKNSEYAQAVAHARNKEWLGVESRGRRV